MPIREISVGEPEAYEAVDVVASSALKAVHRTFGAWMRELAALVHEYYDEDSWGQWQALWFVATKAFSAGYKGKERESAIQGIIAEGASLNVDRIPRIDDLARAAYNLGTKYSGRRAKQRKKAV